MDLESLTLDATSGPCPSKRTPSSGNTSLKVPFCFYFLIVQWGFEYQTSLVFKLSKVIQSPNCPVFECCLSTGLNLVQYSDHHLNTLQVKVPYLDVSIVQMFTKYSRDLKPGLAWIWTDPKEVDLQIVQILNGI